MAYAVAAGSTRSGLTGTGHRLRVRLADRAMVANPDLFIVFIVGGTLAEAGALLFDAIRQILVRTTVNLLNRDHRMASSTLGHRADVLGAVALALEQPRALEAVLAMLQ